MNKDIKTAQAFANSWNNLPKGSVYTVDQFEDWLNPLTKKDFEGKDILELGCGNGSLIVHSFNWHPKTLTGVDLGDSVVSARRNVSELKGSTVVKIIQSDLVDFKSDGYDLVYCIGVLHHLKKPKDGLDSVIRNTKSGGRFHAWVYAKEGNVIVRFLVDPLRKVVSKLPWWFTKYIIATPLSFLYFIYAKVLSLLSGVWNLKFMPLYEYSLWISKRGFLFFRHVAFDQLVTPQTAYISREEIDGWLKSYSEISETYVIMRNGNSWKFGGKKK
jgi:SAM-dependent methyltransferase